VSEEMLEQNEVKRILLLALTAFQQKIKCWNIPARSVLNVGTMLEQMLEQKFHNYFPEKWFIIMLISDIIKLTNLRR
jgi:hypothetical protein